MLKKLELINDNQLRSTGLIFALIGFYLEFYILEVTKIDD